MDHIILRELNLSSVIGVYEGERNRKQPVILTLDLGLDVSEPGQSDDFRQALNYAAVEESVAELVESSQFFLIERLATAVAEHLLSLPQVGEVTVTVDKPGASKRAKSVAVSICRKK